MGNAADGAAPVVIGLSCQEVQCHRATPDDAGPGPRRLGDLPATVQDEFRTRAHALRMPRDASSSVPPPTADAAPGPAARPPRRRRRAPSGRRFAAGAAAGVVAV